MSLLEAALKSGQFAVTTELTPPKGINLTELIAKAESLKHLVHGINLTDSHRAKMSVDPKAVGRILLDRGIEPIVQITARDRNRIAIQSDLLGGALLGIENFVFMSGDKPAAGDHPDAKPVFDLNAAEIVAAATGLNAGRDLAGNELNGTPKLFVGAVANPAARDFDAEVESTRRKLQAGARFLQTQAIYDPALLQKFLAAVGNSQVAVLAGIIPLKSAKMARWLVSNVPGIVIPESLLTEMDSASQRSEETEAGVAIAGRIISSLRGVCAGIHIMAIGAEQHIPRILEAGGVAR